MTVRERLIQFWSSLTYRLLAWAPASVWLTVAVTVVVLAWGELSFGLRQRLDWLVSDLFLRNRIAGAPDPADELVLIAVDEAANNQIRYHLARTLRQLEKLGAHTVMMDYLFDDPGVPAVVDPFFEVEAIYDGIPTKRFGEHVPNVPRSVKERYTDDNLLAGSLRALKSVVLPMEGESVEYDPDVELDIERMTRKIIELSESVGADVDADQLARDMDIPSEITSRALVRAARRLAQAGRAADILKAAETRHRENAWVTKLAAAQDRQLSLDLLKDLSTFPAPTGHELVNTRDLKLPLSKFTALSKFVDGSASSGNLLRVEDIRDWPTFCSELSKEQLKTEDDALTPATRIWELLSGAVRQQILEYAQAGQLTRAQKLRVVAGLNRILGDVTFFQASHFKTVSGVDPVKDRLTEARKLIARGEAGPSSFEIRHINRTLLNAAFHGTIAEARPSRDARLGFANVFRDAGKRDFDSDGVLRRLPLVAAWQNQCVVHLAAAAFAEQREVPLRGLKLDRGELQVADVARIPLDARGRLVINWPKHKHRGSTAAISQVRSTDLLQLWEAEYSLRSTEYNLCEFVALLDQERNLGQGWSITFARMNTAFAEGRVDDAAREMSSIVEKNALHQVLDHPSVRSDREIAERVSGDEIEYKAQTKPVQWVYELLNIRDKFPTLEDDRDALLNDLSQKIEGKLCLVGEMRTGSTDIQQTPVGKMAGDAVIASAVNTMITEKYLNDGGYWASALSLIVVAGGMSVPLTRLRPLGAGLCGFAGLVGAFLASYVLLIAANWIVSPVMPAVGLVGLYITLSTYHWLVEYRQKTLVRTIFAAQTNPTIVDRLIEAGEAGVEEVLAPKSRQVTVFFAQIADFEELARQVAPERMPEIFSKTFGTMAKVILAKEGTLDRYQGHAMVAFFGAPVYQPDHALRACQAALECRDALKGLAQGWASQGLPVPRVEIGLHTGELLVGNITLTSRVDYTVAGDNLNVAYRIGELNETYGTEIMISEPTLLRCDKQIEARELDMVRIKGRREPIRAFELMSAKGQLAAEQLHLCGTFTTGLMAFRNRDYVNAVAMFRACKATSPADRASTLYIERCERELAQTKVATEPPAEP